MKELTAWVEKVIKEINRPKFTEKNMQTENNEKKNERMLIGLCGGLQSGKDTTANFFVDKYGFKRIAFADALREGLYQLNPIIILNGDRLQLIVDLIGWDRAKQDFPEVRRLLQFYGTEAGRDVHGYNCWVDIVKRKLEADQGQDYVITDVRFPNELEMIHDMGGHSIKISRDGFEPSGNHASEMPLEGVQYGIANNGGLRELENSVDFYYNGFKSSEPIPVVTFDLRQAQLA